MCLIPTSVTSKLSKTKKLVGMSGDKLVLAKTSTSSYRQEDSTKQLESLVVLLISL